MSLLSPSQGPSGTTPVVGRLPQWNLSSRTSNKKIRFPHICVPVMKVKFDKK